MQNQFKKLVILVGLFGLNNLALAELKIGVMTPQEIMENKDIAKPVQAKMTDMQNELQQSLQSIAGEIEKKTKALEAKAKVANPATLEKEQDEIKDLQNKYELAAKSAKEKFDRLYNKVMMEFGQLVQQAAEKVRSELGLDLIINKEATLAYSKSIDVTDKIVDAIKKLQASTKGK